MTDLETQCCIAGGGPAGLMLGYLLARQGVDVVVLEKHADFLRDFRGDTVHPSTLQLFNELGYLDELLTLPHQKTERIKVTVSGQEFSLADFTQLNVPAPYIAMMPQWDLLDFIARKARKLSNFKLLQSTEATGLIENGGRVGGITAIGAGGPVNIRADLCVAADGRNSCLRAASKLPLKDIGAPIDVFWFRLPRQDGNNSESMGTANASGFLVQINRGEYWQCALPFLKGSADHIRLDGLAAFKTRIAAIKPQLTADVAALKSWDDVKLLTVQVNRLTRWYKDGLLCIGDAAHAMSPIGGVGINLAVQDAAAAARILGPVFSRGRPEIRNLKAVQDRRERAARITQAIQITAHKRVLVPALNAGKHLDPPKILKVINRFPQIQGLLARAIGMGLQPEHWQDK
ncbi:FAD-dependent oxidoreductase [Robiginitomaculum antarcticum]|uniref:FAD-dependent oxidoreductase n=1 Tax=Robiginitomaculum antarcticum TaxID=437507 RepID=UPI00036A57D6|nr:FAD-dependent oxidoreductase [Robiginitomaculum antarcticum]